MDGVREVSVGVLAAGGLERAGIVAILQEFGIERAVPLLQPDLGYDVLVVREGLHVSARALCAEMPGRPDRATRILAITDGGGRMAEAIRAGADGVLPLKTRPSVLIRAIWDLVCGHARIPIDVLESLISGKGRIVLDPVERAVLDELARGASDAVIQQRCNLTQAVVREVITGLRHRLHAERRFNIVIEAYRHGLLP